MTLLVAYMDKAGLLHHTIQRQAAGNDKTGHTYQTFRHISHWNLLSAFFVHTIPKVSNLSAKYHRIYPVGSKQILFWSFVAYKCEEWFIQKLYIKVNQYQFMIIVCNHTWFQNTSMIQMPSLPSHFKRVPIFQVSYNTTKHSFKLLICISKLK